MVPYAYMLGSRRPETITIRLSAGHFETIAADSIRSNVADQASSTACYRSRYQLWHDSGEFQSPRLVM